MEEKNIEQINMTEVGARIKAKRKQQKLSIYDVAKEVDLSPTYISQIENGQKPGVKCKHLIKIAQLLEMDLDYFFYGKG